MPLRSAWSAFHEDRPHRQSGSRKIPDLQPLTGLGVEVNKYPGSAIGLECGNVCYKNEKIELVDLPGIYSLDGDSEEEVLSGVSWKRMAPTVS